jgi:hypothetical protein
VTSLGRQGLPKCDLEVGSVGEDSVSDGPPCIACVRQGTVAAIQRCSRVRMGEVFGQLTTCPRSSWLQMKSISVGNALVSVRQNWAFFLCARMSIPAWIGLDIGGQSAVLQPRPLEAA